MLATLGTAARQPSTTARSDALAEYVARPDETFSWKAVEQRDAGPMKVALLECTSQTWRGGAWNHDLLVVWPAQRRNTDIAFLLISGDGKVEGQLGFLRRLAASAGAMAAVINRVPNQPLYDGRKEDALIAYTFDQYLKSGDRTWPLLFPMVKTAVRGMDTIQAFAQKETGQTIERFVVGGASKRGWTTWLTAAVDPRVKAIAPMVIDMLNMKAQTEWAEKMYGRQSEQIGDYVDLNLIARMDEPAMVQLRHWVDPYSYRTRYTMAKLLLLGTNDPYWVVDSLRHYWNELPEPKLVFQTPNAGHDLAGGREANLTLAAFYQMVADHQALPRITWQFGKETSNAATVVVNLNQPAKAFRLWTSTAAERDFRKTQWSSTPLTPSSSTNVIAMIERPASGFEAYLIEAEMTNAAGHSYKLSTEARVIPDGAPEQPKKIGGGR